MKIIQAINKKNTWEFLTPKQDLKNPLIFVFGDRFRLENKKEIDTIRAFFPTGHFVFCSTAGEILDDKVHDNSIVLTAIEFEKSTFKIYRENILDYNKDSKLVAEALFRQIDFNNLKHRVIISEGSFINGNELVDGLQSNVASLTGGLSGDGARFEKTLVSYNDYPKEGEIVMIAFYGESLDISYASYGGWIPFGPERVITKSKGNIIYELDGKPALELYKKYLGDKAKELPASAFLFPLSVQSKIDKLAIVRGVIGIDEQNKSMIFAGDIPENGKARLMIATVDNVINGAINAAQNAMKGLIRTPEFALLISCTARKSVLKQRVEEEAEEIKMIIGNNTLVTGFYSYGEIAPFHKGEKSNFHNQTMTLTLFSEV